MDITSTAITLIKELQWYRTVWALYDQFGKEIVDQILPVFIKEGVVKYSVDNVHLISTIKI